MAVINQLVKQEGYIRDKNIVFDMGNVLVRFDPELFMNRYSLTGEDRKLIRNEVFRSVEWIMLDRGVIDEEIAEQRILPLYRSVCTVQPVG